LDLGQGRVRHGVSLPVAVAVAKNGAPVSGRRSNFARTKSGFDCQFPMSRVNGRLRRAHRPTRLFGQNGKAVVDHAN
jgi:hypothetical protein